MAASQRRRRRVRWIILATLGLGVLWAAFAAYQLNEARKAASAGIDRLEAQERVLTVDKLLDGKGLEELDRARADFAEARSAVENPLLAPARFLPVAGRQFRSVDALVSSAETAVDAGTNAVRQAQTTVDQRDAIGRVEALRNLTDIAATTGAELATIDLGPRDGLVGPLAEKRHRFDEELTKVTDGLERVEAAAAGMTVFMDGPSRYLVFAANNAEMRAGSGMLLSAGPLAVAGGEFEMGEMTPTKDLKLPIDTVPITDADLDDRWGFEHPNAEWRNLAMSPNFPVTAELAARMWQAATGETVDGVIALDPIALEAVLRVVGDVEVDGEVITADAVVKKIFITQYEGLTDRTQAERRERLSGIARAAIDALDRDNWDAADFVREMQDVASGRHILAWSSIPEEQAAWEAARLDGALRPDSLGVAVLSEGGNKLDQFLEVNADLEIEPGDERTTVEVAVTLTNATPTGLPSYVQGPSFEPDPPRGVGEGVYEGILAITMPGAAGNARFSEGQALVTGGPDGPTNVLATRVQLTRGESRTVVLRFQFLGRPGKMQVEPSARVPGIRWTYDGRTWTDDEAKTVIWR